jgi:hypothetical protein
MNPTPQSVMSQDMALNVATTSSSEVTLYESSSNAIDASTPLCTKKKYWCSWCYEPTEHEDYYKRRLMKVLPARRVRECLSCHRRTIACVGCTAGMARVRDLEGVDAWCSVCNGTIRKWGETPKEVGGFCSWCFIYANMEIIKKRVVGVNVLFRDEYECSNCHHRTAPCRSCKVAFSRVSHYARPDARCCVCDGTVPDWSDPERNKLEVTLERWCSWCIEFTEHRLEKHRSMTLIRRDIYSCDACHLKTVPCVGNRCDKLGMARGGTLRNDRLCAICSSKKPDLTWNGIYRLKVQTFEYVRTRESVQESLRRPSVYKTSACRAGMQRPFLLLISMSPALRMKTAASLSLLLISQPFFGDSHAESWYIISAKRRGLISRANESWETLNPVAGNCDWYRMVRRLMLNTFKVCTYPEKPLRESVAASNQPTSTLLADLEEDFLACFARLYAHRLSEEERQSLRTAAHSEEALRLKKKMQASGLRQEKVAVWSASVVYQSAYLGLTPVTSMASTAALSATISAASAVVPGIGLVSLPIFSALWYLAPLSIPLAAIGFVPLAMSGISMTFGSSYDVLFPPIQMIITQRICLAAEGIRLEDFYQEAVQQQEDAKFLDFDEVDASNAQLLFADDGAGEAVGWEETMEAPTEAEEMTDSMSSVEIVDSSWFTNATTQGFTDLSEDHETSAVAIPIPHTATVPATDATPVTTAGAASNDTEHSSTTESELEALLYAFAEPPTTD